MSDDPQRVEMIPILPSLDIGETQAFYRDQLGFAVTYETPAYLIVRRQEMELHFQLTDRRALCEASAVYIRGGRIGSLHREYSEKAVPQLTALEVRPWNMEEFSIHDPHGNLLRFGRIPGR